MKNQNTEIKLKGGSLNSTCLIHSDKLYNGLRFVRKSVSLKENREYGFQRWYSQLKRIQRYSVLFPGVFPKLLGHGMEKDNAFFNIEYIEGSTTGLDFLVNTTDENEINIFLKSLQETMNTMYYSKFPTIVSDNRAMELYLREEVYQRLSDCESHVKFTEFLKYEVIEFQGENIPSFITQLDLYKNIALKYYKNPIETFTHGNLTLENILYHQEKNQIYFIDPYEENIIDSPLAEYSQLLQSSNSLYEVYNNGTPTVFKNKVNMDVTIPIGLRIFNNKLLNSIKENFNKNDLKIIKILEISQFIRMLPFKALIDKDKIIFFYSLASKLLNDLIVGEINEK